MNNKNKFLSFLKNEISGWKIFELTLLISSSILILTLGIIAKDSVVAIIAGITGTIGVILGAKGKLSAFIIATVNSIMYIIIAFQGILISSVILHTCFYIPMNIVGFFLWIKNRNKKDDVIARRLSFKGIMFSFMMLMVMYLIYSLIMYNFSIAKNVWFDCFILISTIIAILLMVFRYVDQWILWILANIMNLTMWVIIIINIQNEVYEKTTAIIFVIMYISYLINSVYGIINWIKLKKSNESIK
ncbi:nicotinamide mononucleotide transporter [Spiroplasma litorale]|uniref:Nicotinamide mononucleotide transporter n=1 Tax=Spiroplasma litorale TaxID=216942 RepID=A0A0K1W1M5_9MOLU|nr:nicotinamide riboside transporter PnuC [Spiroplasma litorale]AKX34224.1 nicotinamide mononucleotide transporter [Spiroplasma litorale]